MFVWYWHIDGAVFKLLMFGFVKAYRPKNIKRYL